MLTTSEIALMRTTIEDALPGTAVIHTSTLASDGQGGWIPTYSASGTVVARLSPEGLRGEEPELAGRISEVRHLVLTIPAETTVSVDDRIVYDGETFDVVEVRDRTPWELSRRVRVVEVD